MNKIVKPITPDGKIGFDEFDQLTYERQERDCSIYSPISDPRGSTCLICLRGWETTTESIVDQFLWRSREKWIHKSCWVRYLTLREYDMWYGALCSAGITFFFPEEIPNQYGGAWMTPWYTVKLRESRCTLRLGSRKRVYNMEILVPKDEAGVLDVAAAAPLKKEDVTQDITGGRVMIHAWGEAKAKEYMKVFADILKASTSFTKEKAGSR